MPYRPTLTDWLGALIIAAMFVMGCVVLP